jgi:hypothetical protein
MAEAFDDSSLSIPAEKRSIFLFTAALNRDAAKNGSPLL